MFDLCSIGNMQRDVIYVKCVLVRISDMDNDLIYSKPDGLLRVGSNETIDCMLRKPISNTSEKYMIIQSYLTNGSQLVSLMNGTSKSQIRPPSGSPTYPKAGMTIIKCEYAGPNNSYYTKNLTVRIIRE